MDCLQAREAVSACLDAEEPGVDSGTLEAHLMCCPACRAWRALAGDLQRRLRVGPAEEPAPDVTAEILEQVQLPRPAQRRSA